MFLGKEICIFIVFKFLWCLAFVCLGKDQGVVDVLGAGVERLLGDPVRMDVDFDGYTQNERTPQEDLLRKQKRNGEKKKYLIK
jgi:hypothetical protein